MKQFKKEKEKLIAELNQLAKKFPEYEWVNLLEASVAKITTSQELNGSFKEILTTIKRIAKFEKYFMDKINLIQSKELRKLAKQLKKEKCKITYEKTKINYSFI